MAKYFRNTDKTTFLMVNNYFCNSDTKTPVAITDCLHS
jgi:hypothetical protein